MIRTYVLIAAILLPMSRIILEKVLLHRKDGMVPHAFIWRGRVYRITSVVNWWREPGAWWEGEPVCFFLRVTAKRETEGVCDLCRVGQDWLLYRIYD